MSDTGPQIAYTDFGNLDQGQGVQGQPQGSQDNPDGLANPFLQNVPIADRPIVEKYIRQWDAGVTRRFQDIHNQYAPLRNLMQQHGVQDPSVFGQAYNLYDYVNSDPEGFLRLVAEQLGVQIVPMDQQGTAAPGVQEQSGTPPSGLPDEIASRFQTMEQAVANLSQWYQGQQQSQQSAAEDAQLDQLLGQMHQQFGNFDEEYVMTKMLQGQTPQQAMQSWNQFVQSIINQSRRPVPPALSGVNSGIPTPGNGRRSPADSRKLAAAMLEAARDQG